jgi:hypothetical protein
VWAVRLHAGASRHMLALQPGMAAAVALAAKTGVGGKNDKAAKDGDEAGDLMSPAELRGALKKADTRGKPSSCVVGLTRDKRAVILVDHLPKPRKLLASAKAQGQAAGLDLDLASLRFGRMSVSGKQVDITVNKAVAPALELKLRPVMRAAAHPAFTINADPAIEDEPEDGADRDGAGAVPGRAGPGTPGPGPSPGLAVPAAAAAASVNGSGAIENGTAAPRSPLAGMVPPDLARGVQAAVAADPSRKPALARLLAQVRAGVESGDPHAAEAEIAALRQALDAAPPLPGEERTAQGRAAGAGQAASAPATPAEGPRLMQADATLADLARAWDAEQAKAAPGGLARQGGPKAPAPPASKRATAPAPFSGGEGLLSGQSDRTAGLAWPGLPGDDGGLGGAGLATPVFQGHGNRPVPPAGRAPALQAPGQAPAPLGRGGSVPSAGRAPPPQASSPLPPGLVPEVQGPSPLPGGRTVAREGLRAGGRAAGRFLVTKPNPYLMVAGVVLLVAMELMPRADEGGGEATVTLRQHGAGGQPGREVATLHMDQTGALRAEPGGRGAVLGQMDPAGRITLTPAGEAYLAERAKGVQAPPAPGGFPGGAHDAMGNWTGPGAPGEGSPQPAAPGPADAGAASPPSSLDPRQSKTVPPGTAGAAQPSPAPSALPQASAGGNTGRLPPEPPQRVRQDGECDEDENMGPTSTKRRLPSPKTGTWKNADGSPGGPGNSQWFSNNQDVQAVTGGRGVPFINGRPDFTPWARMSINLPYGDLTGRNKLDFPKVYEAMSRADPNKFPTPRDAERYADQHNLTPHHALDTCMQLVPEDLNALVPHIGSASDMRANPPAVRNQPPNAEGQTSQGDQP